MFGCKSTPQPKADVVQDMPEGFLQEVNNQSAAQGFTLEDTTGKAVSLADYKGKVVAIAFWATWCTSCKAEMSVLKDLKKQFGGQGFEVLSINVDTPDQKSRAISIVRSKRLNYPVLLDPESKVATQFNPGQELPYTVFIGKDGRARYELKGYVGNEERMMQTSLSALLKE